MGTDQNYKALTIPPRMVCSLDRISTMRSKYYRSAKTNNDPEALSVSQKLEKILDAVKQKIRIIAERLAEKLPRSKPGDTEKWLRKLINTNQKTQGGSRNQLEPHRPARHIATEVGHGAKPVQFSVTVDKNFYKLRKPALLRTPRLRAAGADEVFSEALSCAPD